LLLIYHKNCSPKISVTRKTDWWHQRKTDLWYQRTRILCWHVLHTRSIYLSTNNNVAFNHTTVNCHTYFTLFFYWIHIYRTFVNGFFYLCTKICL